MGPDAAPRVGSYVRLDPLAAADADELARLLLDPRLYELCPLWFPTPTTASDAARLASDTFVGRHSAGTGHGDGRLTYGVRLLADSPLGERGRLVGTTSVSEVDLATEKAHVGGTLYHPDVWGTVVNAECKLLLLGACFERWGYGRVKIQTDAVNARSRAAIAGIGAVPEGVLRRESRRGDGTFRDVAVYSILRDEWPTVKAGLQARIAAGLDPLTPGRTVTASDTRH